MRKLVLATIALALISTTSTAEAKRGIAIINTGEDVAFVAEVKEEMRAEIEANSALGAKVGFMYSRFGLFWLDIWRWDGKFVIYAGDTVYNAPNDVIENVSAGPLKAPFTYRLPPGLIVIIILVISGIGFVVWSRRGSGGPPSPGQYIPQQGPPGGYQGPPGGQQGGPGGYQGPPGGQQGPPGGYQGPPGGYQGQ